MNSDDINNQDQLKEITASIISMAALDFNSPPPIRGSSPLGAVAAGLIALNEELRASVVARTEAEYANEAKAQFLANMSHELRTPLTSLIGGMDLMAESDLSSSQRDTLIQMREASDRLFRLINDVLDFSKIEAGRLQLENQPMCPHTTMAGVFDRYSNQAEAKGLDFSSNHSTLPSLWILGDRQRIEQVLNNLIENAIKYTNKGAVSIHTDLHIQGSCVRFSVAVSDTGPGIESHQQERIFQRFTSGGTPLQHHQDSTGLGLSIAMAIALEMNGELKLESTPPNGSCFSFSVDLELAHQSTKKPKQKKSRLNLRQHILLVDDTEMVRNTTTKMLELLGCTVVAATCGREAIGMVKKEDFDLILMDRRMPDLDGLEVAALLFKLHPHRNLRIASLTAHATQEDIQKSKKAGLLGQLNKPFTLSEIATFIQQLDRDYPPH